MGRTTIPSPTIRALPWGLAPGLLGLGACAAPGAEVALQIEAIPHPDLVLAQEIRVTADPAASLQLECTSDDVPEEDHRVASPTQTTHALRLTGLLAEVRYECTIAVLGDDRTGGGSVSFTTHPLPWGDEAPEVDILPIAGDRYGDYVLMNHVRFTARPRTQRLVIHDPEGRMRWYWTFPEASTSGIEALWDGQTILVGGGRGINPQRMTLWGEVVTRVPDPHTGGASDVYHHETLALSSGEIVGLSSTEDTAEGFDPFEGFGVNVFDPQGTLTYGVASQGAIDAGTLAVPSQNDDPFHANAVVWTDDADGPAVWVNLKASDQLVRFDRDTGDLTWTMGPGGDFALFDAAGQPLGDDDWFTGQHAPALEGNRLLIYDNGVRRPNGVLRTRVAEYLLDVSARTATLGWTFDRVGWYEPFHGDVDRLPNGHVLVTSGHCHDCEFSGGRDVSSFVIEVDPATDEIVFEMRMAWDDGIYRSEVIAGCDLFANRRYCP